MSYVKVPLDPRPFRVGKVRTAYPGWLNGQHTEYDPREEFGHTFKEED